MAPSTKNKKLNSSGTSVEPNSSKLVSLKWCASFVQEISELKVFGVIFYPKIGKHSQSNEALLQGTVVQPGNGVIAKKKRG